MKDLIVLTADKNTEFLLRGLLPRIPVIEKTRSFSFDIYPHIHKDAGVFNTAHEFLRPFSDQYQYTMVVFDHEGCGHEHISREEMEKKTEDLLSANGWPDRAGVLVISPEIENWVWVHRSHIERAISWDIELNIYTWLHKKNLKDPASAKPSRPKEAFEAALFCAATPRSSSIYLELAEKASYRNCADPAFLKMLALMRNWFK